MTVDHETIFTIEATPVKFGRGASAEAGWDSDLGHGHRQHLEGLHPPPGRGRTAPDRGATVGLAHVIGLGSACGVHILEKAAA